MGRLSGKLTQEQESEARRLAGTMKQSELAEHLGCSGSNLIRWARDQKLSLDSLSSKPEIVRAVCSFYGQHGSLKTQKAFPNVKVRSIVERYKLYEPRQTRWTDEQLIEAARMAGLVSLSAQAKHFKRPNASSGSIMSLWMKRFGFSGGSINGMVHEHAKHLVTMKAEYLKPMSASRKGEKVQFRKLILWVDMEHCLKPETPAFIKSAIHTLADFQRWLHGDSDPKLKIIKMIEERECCDPS